MSTKTPRRQNGSGNDLRPTLQTETRCRILGIDVEGVEHVHDRERNRIVALDASGIEAQYDLDELDNDAADYMHWIDEERGWAKEQWLGYKWVEALTGAFEEADQ
ncbi:MAG: hypothetical protein ACOCUO_02110, partial [archaeon]